MVKRVHAQVCVRDINRTIGPVENKRTNGEREEAEDDDKCCLFMGRCGRSSQQSD